MAVVSFVDGLSGGTCAGGRPGVGHRRRSRRVVICFIWGFGCTLVRLGVAADRSVRTPASFSAPSTLQHGRKSEEHGQMRVVTEHPVDQLPAGADDLTGDLDEGIEERSELHPQDAMFLGLVFFVPTALLRQPKCPPGLEVPGQGRRHHVGPIAVQVVDRGRQRPHSTGQLGDQVLLVAAVVGLEHDVFRVDCPIVGDVEEVANLVEQPSLAFLVSDVLAKHNHPIRLLTFAGLILELGVVLVLQPEHLELAAADDPLLHVHRPLPRIGFDFVAWRSQKLPPGRFWQAVRDFLQIRHGLEAEVEGHAVAVPRIEFFGLAEGRIAAEHDLAEPRPAAQRDGLVGFLSCPFMAGTIAGTVDQPQHLARFGQREYQRVITPSAFVGDVHSLLALAGGDHQRSVHVDRGPVEELRGLPGPHVQPSVVDGCHQRADVSLGKAAAEVAGRGGVGNPLGAQRVEEDLVVAPQFDVFQPNAVAHRVVGQIQHVIRLVIGAVDFQHLDPAVDRLDQTGRVGQLVDQADAAVADGPRLVGQFHTNLRRREHRLTRVLPRAVQPPLNPPLGIPQTIPYNGLHSKSSLLTGSGTLLIPLRLRKTRKVSSFSMQSA